jgi:hypothetical protein
MRRRTAARGGITLCIDRLRIDGARPVDKPIAPVTANAGRGGNDETLETTSGSQSGRIDRGLVVDFARVRRVVLAQRIVKGPRADYAAAAVEIQCGQSPDSVARGYLHARGQPLILEQPSRAH